MHWFERIALRRIDDAAAKGELRGLKGEGKPLDPVRLRESADDVRAWLIERYGDYITYNPPLSPATALLWALPLLAIVAGLWLARGTFRRRQR